MSRARDVADGALGKIAGTNGQVLTSNGSAWSSQAVPTELPATGSDGNILTSTGSAWASEANPLPAHSTVGNVLTSTGSAWASQAAAGGGAWELLQTTKIPSSNTSTSLIAFTNKFTTDYDVYQFVGASLQPTSSGFLYLYSKLLDSNGGGINGNYGFINEYSNIASGANGYRSHTNSNFTYMPLSFEGQRNGNGYSQSFILNVFDPLRNIDGNYVNFQSQGVTTNNSPFQVYTSDIRGWWFLDTSTKGHGLEFFFSSGNMSGQISLYGLKK